MIAFVNVPYIVALLVVAFVVTRYGARYVRFVNDYRQYTVAIVAAALAGLFVLLQQLFGNAGADRVEYVSVLLFLNYPIAVALYELGARYVFDRVEDLVDKYVTR